MPGIYHSNLIERRCDMKILLLVLLLCCIFSIIVLITNFKADIFTQISAICGWLCTLFFALGAYYIERRK